MARPTNKEELILLSEKNFKLLKELINSVSEKDQKRNFSFEDRDKNIRDILAHLYEWHLMLLGWYEVGMQGKLPKIPAEGYTWKTLPLLNEAIWKKYQDTNLDIIKQNLENSHEKIIKLIKKHSNEELFTPKKYTWTKTTSLGSYFISSTSSHYEWAIKKIKKYKKELK